MRYGPEEHRDFHTQSERKAIRRAGYVEGLQAAIKIVQSNSKSKSATTRQIRAEIKRVVTH